tara:strand:+ start:193 stop:534 length:342 start_codon:yes stop_codon:yes gene_type:complete
LAVAKTVGWKKSNYSADYVKIATVKCSAHSGQETSKMDMVRRSLKRAREAEPMSHAQYSAESWALGTIKGMVSYWADTSFCDGKRMKNEWAKEVLERIKELDRVFKEDSHAKE